MVECCEECGDDGVPLVARLRVARVLFMHLHETLNEVYCFIAVFDACGDVHFYCAVGRVSFEIVEVAFCRFEVFGELLFEMVAEPDIVGEDARALFAVELRLHHLKPLFEILDVGENKIDHVTIIVLLNI